jgi:hypothetical protein
MGCSRVCRMPRALGVTQSCETGDGRMDDQSRIGRAPRRRWTTNASRTQRISHPEDGTSGVIRCGCQRLVAWALLHHLCSVRVNDPAALKWLLDHGANPTCRDHGYEISGHAYPGTALETRYNTPAVLPLGRLDNLAELIDADPGLLNNRFRNSMGSDRRTFPSASRRNAFACGCGIRQRGSARSCTRP